MWRHCRKLILVLVYVCAYVNTYEYDGGDNLSCVNATVGTETDKGLRLIYLLEPQIEYFQINIPECKRSDKAGLSVTVCGNKAITKIKLVGMDYMVISRNGDVSMPGRAEVALYCV